MAAGAGLAALVAPAAAGELISAEENPAAAPALRIAILSSAPERVSGGDALVEISGPRNAVAAARIWLNGLEITATFKPGAGSSRRTGLVTGFREGRNRITAAAAGAKDALNVINYPASGPIFSGPHVTPYICQTHQFRLPDGTYLGQARNAKDCFAPSRVVYVYKSSATGRFLPLPDRTRLPPDVASTTTLAGRTVPFVVRFEAGVIDRGVYNIAVLHDPASEGPPSALAPPSGWAGRLLWVHGFGCTGGWYYQGTNTGSLDGIYPVGAPRSNTIEAGFNVMREGWLGKGYAIATSTLNHPSINCNPMLAGEATAMVKEHFIESFGVPQFTLSTGSSGGAYFSLQIADAFPGLFDGVLVSSVFPDALSIALSGMDGHLLTHYFAASGTAFSPAQQVEVSGYAGLQAFHDAANQAGRGDPVSGRADIKGYASGQWRAIGSHPDKEPVPPSLRYHPTDNPRGARPTIFDLAGTIYGHDPRTGYAYRPFDNVGVQYGLAALNNGSISVDQFLDLNAKIGGYDHDMNYVAQRSSASAGVLRRTYQSGILLSGGGGLRNIPIFDYGGYNEDTMYHYQWFHFAVRERLALANGQADNMVMWRSAGTSLDPPASAIQAMDRWMLAYRTDGRAAALPQKVVENRPADLVDGCFSRTEPQHFIAERQQFGRSGNTRCIALWPSYSDPRQVAGGPLSANILKCRLKPVRLEDYKPRFTAAQVAALGKVFPRGVCDWSRPGVGQQGSIPWASFGPSPSNRIAAER